jgi:hypothetical protein
MAIDQGAFVCHVCGRYLEPTDLVVQTVRISHHEDPIDGTQVEDEHPGAWFHEEHWGAGQTPFREIDRGPLGEILKRA